MMCLQTCMSGEWSNEKLNQTTGRKHLSARLYILNTTNNYFMKTLKEWEEGPEIDLDKYLAPMDEIDEALYMHMGEVAPPKYCASNESKCNPHRQHFVQMCDPDYHIDDIPFYMTGCSVGNRYFYLGILPEFNQ